MSHSRWFQNAINQRLRVVFAAKANGASAERLVDLLKVIEHAFRIFSSDVIHSIEFKALTVFIVKASSPSIPLSTLPCLFSLRAKSFDARPPVTKSVM